ncbi:MAG TPA: phosphopantetheine-binding protein [Azospirillum sp.]
MTPDTAFACIKGALEKAIKRDVAITPETDLIEEGIVDSLEGMSFIMELETMSGKTVPEDGDLVELGFYKVDFLIKFLTA